MMELNEHLKPTDKWAKRKECMKALNSLYITVPKSIADDIKQKVIEALEEEHQRGMDDGKISR